jgi:hypothetical protein
MKVLPFLLTAFAISAALFSTANAHPNHPAPVAAAQWVQLEPEEVMSFDADGETFTVWNTHHRGILGLELIEVRNSTGTNVAGWWSSRGWCFTQQAYSAQGCWSDTRYLQIVEDRMSTSNYTRSLNVRYSGSAGTDATTFCDHYTQLEYTISGDSSERCDYE